MTPVRLEPAASRSRVKHSITETLRSRLDHLLYAVLPLQWDIFLIQMFFYSGTI